MYAASLTCKPWFIRRCNLQRRFVPKFLRWPKKLFWTILQDSQSVLSAFKVRGLVKISSTHLYYSDIVCLYILGYIFVLRYYELQCIFFFTRQSYSLVYTNEHLMYFILLSNISLLVKIMKTAYDCIASLGRGKPFKAKTACQKKKRTKERKKEKEPSGWPDIPLRCRTCSARCSGRSCVIIKWFPVSSGGSYYIRRWTDMYRCGVKVTKHWWSAWGNDGHTERPCGCYVHRSSHMSKAAQLWTRKVH